MSLVAPPPRQTVRDPGTLPRVSPFLTWGFERYLRKGFGLRGGFVPRHFHAVRLAKGLTTAIPADRPLVFYLNHSSWWDPITAFLLARHLVPGRHPYAPVDRAALDRYPFLERVGLFGVEKSARGAKAFLDTARAVLARPDASLWLTPEGAFRDSRSRPVRFEPGLGHLAVRAEALFVPVAIEYRFWDERLPEVLTRVGTPIESAEGADVAAGWTDRFEQALEATLDRLHEDAERRDPARFETILAGRAGVSAVYDLVRRVRSLATGRRYAAEHSDPGDGVGRV